MKCPVCFNPATVPALSGTDRLFETTPRTFRLDACSACDCLFLNPLPADDELAGFYPRQYWWTASNGGTLRGAEALYRKIVLSDHIAFIRRAARNAGGNEILDVGCGSGTLLGLLKRRGFHVTGVDFSSEAARVAEIENGVRVMVGSLVDARFHQASFDVVTLFHVMEHVTNPRDVLTEVSRILRPDGRLVLQVPNIDSWQFRLFGARWYGLDIPRHVIDYSKSAMLKLLAGSGFQAERVRDFNLRDNAPALVSSLLPSLDPMRRAVCRNEPMPVATVRHLAYFTLVCCAYPLVILESACGHGATIMIEARKK